MSIPCSFTDSDSYVSMLSTSATPTEDPEFFYSSADFEVEGVCFRLPTQIFEQSPLFLDSVVFKEPDSEPGRFQYRGVGSARRFLLKDVTAAEFRDFLRILLDSPWRRSVDNAAFSPDAYMSFMRLATLWKFDRIREDVANSLFAVKNPALRLLVGTRFDQKQLIPSALRELTERSAPLEQEEYLFLGLDLAVRVAKLREHCLAKPGSSGLRTLGNMSRDRWDRLMVGIFGQEFVEAFKEGRKLESKRPVSCAQCQRS